MRVDHGRTALYLIAQLLAPGKVWAPAYHCPAAIEPLIAAGCEVAFYPIEADLAPDHGFIKANVRAGESLIGVRHFGFDTGIRELAAFCASKGVLLIEDLAHAAYFDQLLGSFGVTSLLKFLPVTAGGELLVAETSEHAAHLLKLCRGLPSPLRMRMKAGIRKLGTLLPSVRHKRGGYRYFHIDRICQGFAPNDETIISNADHAGICERRRDNYRYLAKVLSGSPSGEAVFPVLPDNVVPYVFPFLLNDEEGFWQVRRAGIQALRWEEMVPTDCEIVGKLRTRLIQLPVHQGLERHQLDVVAAALMS